MGGILDPCFKTGKFLDILEVTIQYRRRTQFFFQVPIRKISHKTQRRNQFIHNFSTKTNINKLLPNIFLLKQLEISSKSTTSGAVSPSLRSTFQNSLTLLFLYRSHDYTQYLKIVTSILRLHAQVTRLTYSVLTLVQE